jgi:hypothetical protein
VKVLVASREGQGRVEGDYSFTVEGELVTPVVFECCSSDRCGCSRGFAGLASSRATTTAEVADRPDLTRDELCQAVEDSLWRDGWLTHLTEEERAELVDEHVRQIELVGRAFPAGTLVCRYGGSVWSRDGLDAPPFRRA